MLADKKRVVLDRPIDVWVEAALRGPRVELLPRTPSIALRAAALHGLPPPRNSRAKKRCVFATRKPCTGHVSSGPDDASLVDGSTDPRVVTRDG